MACARCGTALRAGDRFCGGCGSGVPNGGDIDADAVTGPVSRRHMAARQAEAGRANRSLPPRRRRGDGARLGLVAAVVGAVGGLVAALIAVVAYLAPPVPPLSAPLSGKLTVAVETAFYYPHEGALPSASPPALPPGQGMGHCDDWAEWATEQRMAPSGTRSIYIQASAGRTSPITILSARFETYKRTPLVGARRVQCQYGAGGVLGTAVFPNLDAPSGRLPMDVNGDGEPEASMPGSSFVVDTARAESLTALLTGTENNVYEYGIVLEVVENGARSTERIGSPEAPLRIAIEGSDADLSAAAVDWDYAHGRWAPAGRCLNAPEMC